MGGLCVLTTGFMIPQCVLSNLGFNTIVVKTITCLLGCLFIITSLLDVINIIMDSLQSKTPFTNSDGHEEDNEENRRW